VAMSTIDEQRPSGGKRERTRAALVGATLEIVAEKGIAAASLDEIAARAGMTKGAIYSNFSGKAELLLAAVGAKGLTIASDSPQEVTLREHLRRFARELADITRRAQGEARFLAELQLYALTDPDLRREASALYAESFASNAAFLAESAGLKAGLPPRHLAVALQSIALGFLMQSLITPDEVTEEIIAETLAALAQGVTDDEADGVRA
jgi:AcrR family transcriptional regulator